jgi:integration host factor subunit beta
MTKVTISDIVETLTANSKWGVTKKLCESVVIRTFDEIVASLLDNEVVYIHGLGTFTTVNKSARTARNPKTGASVDVPAKIGVKFKPAKLLKERLNK